MIVAAAVQHQGYVYGLPVPARHGDILNRWPTIRSADCVCGFIDNNLGFVTRKAAWKIAEEHVQLLPAVWHQQLGTLYSEDIW